MNINDFIDKFYTDSEYQEQVINDIKQLKGRFDNTELIEHQKVLDTLHYEMLFNRINNEIYSKKVNIDLEEIEI